MKDINLLVKLKEQIEKLKETKAFYEGKLELLENQKKEIEEELKNLGITFEDIDGILTKEFSELEKIYKTIQELIKEININLKEENE